MLNEKSLIKDNVKNLRQINEWVGRNDVIDSIENSDIAYIYYAGDNTVNRGYRTIEPYTLGIHGSSGNLVLRAWQQAGASDTKSKATRPADQIPGWRLFRLDGITTFMKTFKKFDPTKPRPKYNPNDSDMSQILATVNTDGVPDIKISGTDSVEQPDTIEKNKAKSFFDKQTGGFKSFTQNDELQRNKDISDLYGAIKFNRKQDPIKYIVVDKDGKLWYDKAENESKYKPEQVLGNLNDLYREITGVKGTMQQTNKTFFQNQYKEFEKSLQNQ
jgi:hypothetical protein